MRRLFIGLAAGLAAGSLGITPVIAAAPPTLTAAQMFGDPVVAKGKGFEIRASEVDDAVSGLRASQAAAQQQPFAENQRAEVEARVIERMLLTRMLAQKATAEDQAAAKVIADKLIAETRKRATSESAYRRQLLAVGIKPEIFEQRALEQALVETVLKREIRDQLPMPDEQVQAFYEQGVDVVARAAAAEAEKMAAAGATNTAAYTEAQARREQIKEANLARLQRPDSARASVILVFTVDPATRVKLEGADLDAKKAKIEKALARVKGGEDFVTVALEMSEDPEAERNQAEYATLKEAVVLPELKKALFDGPIGQVSEVISTPVGFYIVKVNERTAAGKMPLEKARADIRDLLLNQELEQRLPAYTEQLKREFNVEMLKPEPKR